MPKKRKNNRKQHNCHYQASYRIHTLKRMESTWLVTNASNNNNNAGNSESPCDTLYIGNLNRHAVSRDALLEHILDILPKGTEEAGQLLPIGLQLRVHPRTGRAASFALAKFADGRAASFALSALQNTILEGHPLFVAPSTKGSAVLTSADLVQPPSNRCRTVRFAEKDQLCDVRYYAKDVSQQRFFHF